MDQKTITAIVIFFVILVVGMFTFAYLKKGEIEEQPTTQEQTPEPEVAYASITRIDGKHYFIDGVHTVAGEIPMPTPCDLLEAGISLSDSVITLDFSVINSAEFCAQQVTPQRFKVSVAGPEDVTFKAMFMGREVELNLIPAAPGETPDDFELFIKG